MTETSGSAYLVDNPANLPPPNKIEIIEEPYVRPPSSCRPTSSAR